MKPPVISKSQSENGAIAIQVTPEAAQVPKMMRLAIGFLGAFVGFVVKDVDGAVVMFVIAAVGGSYLYRRAYLDRYRTPVKFAVSARGIEQNGQVYPAGDIHRVTIKNHLLPELEQDVTEIVVRTNQAGETGRIVGTMARREAAKTCYRVEFEVMGSPRILAGGLKEPEAFALATDVRRALGG